MITSYLADKLDYLSICGLPVSQWHCRWRVSPMLRDLDIDVRNCCNYSDNRDWHRPRLKLRVLPRQSPLTFGSAEAPTGTAWPGSQNTPWRTSCRRFWINICSKNPWHCWRGYCRSDLRKIKNARFSLQAFVDSVHLVWMLRPRLKWPDVCPGAKCGSSTDLIQRDIPLLFAQRLLCESAILALALALCTRPFGKPPRTVEFCHAIKSTSRTTRLPRKYRRGSIFRAIAE